MNDPDRKPAPNRLPKVNSEDDAPSQGPNLILAYSLIAFALLVAIAMAALIVWPYYKAR